MRLTSRSSLSTAVFALALALSSSATAQVDVNPPLSNVLLLIDTSGSMESLSSSNALPTCVPGNSAGSQKNRWMELVEVLTGRIADPSCYAQDRSSVAFTNEYTVSGVAPYDATYPFPNNRILSGTCTPGPGTAPVATYDYPVGTIKYHPYNDASAICAFNQSSDGLLDAFADRVRFGLMTFDARQGAGRGVPFDSIAAGVDGQWSYWFSPPGAKQGKPADCTFLSTLEVGARNAGAPPWEGRMVAFGSPTSTTAQLLSRNAQIQEILLATRPYGATPIAGMLDDAREFMLKDTTTDPVTGAGNFGPYADPFTNQGCRDSFIILLSDGEPNMDLRPFCNQAAGIPGVCPYDKPEDIAFDLANQASPEKRIRTFVVGFAVSDITVAGNPFDCTTLTAADVATAAGSLCATNPTNRELQACCTLSRIGYSGGTGGAHFARDQDALRQAVSNILSTTVPNSTSRTIPVSSSASSVSSTFAAAFRFHSSFEPKQVDLWKGIIERRRFVCKLDTSDGLLKPQPEVIDPAKGDDFVANVNSGVGAARQFISVIGETVAGAIQSTRSIRPTTVGADGLGGYEGTQTAGAAATFVSNVPPEAMSITAATCAPLNAVGCRDKYLLWNVGVSNGTSYHRCPAPNTPTCNLIGDIYHSTPRIVGRPDELLRDESYSLFAAQLATRVPVLYTATNDGFLHAFKIAEKDALDTFKVDTLSNNELWAFIPPAALPDVPAQYPGTHLNLLDGAPVVKDVVATINGGSFTFDRFGADAEVGITSNGTWRTVLVAGYGSHRGAYYALDVTDPLAPKFLWQLSTDDTGAPLFGTGSGTPLITTVFMNDGLDTKEVAVAVLPGGTGPAAQVATCSRPLGIGTDIDASFQPRPDVPCYGGAGIQARSLTIVRLDTGEVIRTFRLTAAEAPAGLALNSRVTPVPSLLSPVTGQPVAFPAETGAVADRIFVGDADGGLFRVDVSKTDPANWTMNLFFDTYPNDLGLGAPDGQPIATRPVLSVDPQGRITIAVSTGDQEVIAATVGMKTYAWSLTETVDTSGPSAKFKSKANWFTEFADGERVTGPMSLFGGDLFFSSFAPEPAGSSDVCKAGSSRIWGVSYIIPSVVADLSKGGQARFPQDPTSFSPTLVQFIDDTSPLLPDDSTIFGVGIAQAPSCNIEVAETGDPIFGGGSHTKLTNVNPGKFQLVMHTGTGGTATLGAKTKTLEIDLKTPALTATIDSWAAVIE